MSVVSSENPPAGLAGAETGLKAMASASLAEQRSDIIGRIERLPFSRALAKIATILASGLFFDGFDTGTLAVTITVIFAEFHIGFLNTGVLLSAGFVGQFVGAWVFGFLSEIFGRKPAFLASMLLFGALSIGSAFAWDFESLVTMRAIQGLGLGGVLAPAVAIFSELVRANRRGKFAGIYQTTFQWGVLLAPAIGLLFFQSFGDHIGWRALFLFGGIPVLVAIYGWFALPESPRWLSDHGRYAEADAVLRDIETHSRSLLPPPTHVQAPELKKTNLAELFSPTYVRRTFVLWVGWACTYFVIYGLNTWMPSLYVRIGGLPVSDALALSIFTAVVRVVTMYSEALIVDRVGRLPLFLTGFTTTALANIGGALAIVWLHYTGWPMLLVVSTAISIGTSLTNILIVNYTAELYPTRLRSLGISAASSMSRLASIIAPSAVGALLAAGLGVESIFMLFGCVALVAAVVVPLWGIETRQRVLEEVSP
jgi:MFS transporter, putative metabolite:H+ symporter